MFVRINVCVSDRNLLRRLQNRFIIKMLSERSNQSSKTILIFQLNLRVYYKYAYKFLNKHYLHLCDNL